MPYTAPVPEFTFLLDHVVGFDAVAGTERYGDASPDMVGAVLTEAGKLCDEVLAPLNRNGDLHPARLENGVVRTSPGFAEGYRAIADGGWVAITAAPEYGGMGLPVTVSTAVNEMMSGACLALQLNPLLTQGQIDALEHHASDEMKALYLPKLISGEWAGTMNLTEPQAGSDVGALSSKAERNDDGRRSSSPGATATSPKTSVTWCWHDCRTASPARRESACSWCRNTCPTRRAIRGWPTASRW